MKTGRYVYRGRLAQPLTQDDRAEDKPSKCEKVVFGVGFNVQSTAVEVDFTHAKILQRYRCAVCPLKRCQLARIRNSTTTPFMARLYRLVNCYVEERRFTG
jgi:hypothetical protein